ncbi:MAG TPA: hypothetical protein VGG54_01325 [Trebonia sp.]|jgi:hypothetical protein
MQDDDLDPSDLNPDEMDDLELLLFRTRLRLEIARGPGNVSPEMTSRYRALNDEVTKRARGEWS